MATFQPSPYGARPDWQEVLQRPYLNQYATSPQSIITAREAAMRAASDTQLGALNAALQAQRDKDLADYIAAHTPKPTGGGGGGGGGGGRRGGGGGGSGSTVSLGSLPVPTGGFEPTFPDSAPAPSPNFTIWPNQDPGHQIYTWANSGQGVPYANVKTPGAPNQGRMARTKKPVIKPKPKVLSARSKAVAI